MHESTLQIHEPVEAASCVPRTCGESLWQRFAWWISLAVLLPVGLGVLQMLALLVQAERVRTALQDGLEVVAMPKANSTQLLDQTRRELTKANLPLGRFSHWGVRGVTLESGSLIELQIEVPTDKLLPKWLGPRLPGVGSDQIQVRWQATVP